jgi:hypothetical protein
MMRLGRRATLLVAFYLVTSTATAYADCAWVLWQRITREGTNPGLFEALSSYPETPCRPRASRWT